MTNKWGTVSWGLQTTSDWVVSRKGLCYFSLYCVSFKRGGRASQTFSSPSPLEVGMTALLSKMPKCLPGLHNWDSILCPRKLLLPQLLPMEDAIRIVIDLLEQWLRSQPPMEDDIRIESLWDGSVLSSHQPGVPVMKGIGSPAPRNQQWGYPCTAGSPGLVGTVLWAFCTCSHLPSPPGQLGHTSPESTILMLQEKWTMQKTMWLEPGKYQLGTPAENRVLS